MSRDVYAGVKTTDPIRQGDIFFGLPRLEVSLREVDVLTESGRYAQQSWRDVVNTGRTATATVALEPVRAIVASQDCDATTGPYITLWQIGRLDEVVGEARGVANSKKVGRYIPLITRHSRGNLKFFYLPIDEEFGFPERMAVDFFLTMRFRREELEELTSLRRCRLAEYAYQHFRERCAEFYRRYPYDEWYPLSKEEYDEYKSTQPGVTLKPYDGQE